ncbi:MAG: hypothetical protein QOD94_2102 [Alphaproteobacteria bacterium]|jgi:hypothetical protein|nr:hypothetical protein [Alphaproteobacteria bacterium]
MSDRLCRQVTPCSIGFRGDVDLVFSIRVQDTLLGIGARLHTDVIPEPWHYPAEPLRKYLRQVGVAFFFSTGLCGFGGVLNARRKASSRRRAVSFSLKTSSATLFGDMFDPPADATLGKPNIDIAK